MKMCRLVYTFIYAHMSRARRTGTQHGYPDSVSSYTLKYDTSYAGVRVRKHFHSPRGSRPTVLLAVEDPLSLSPSIPSRLGLGCVTFGREIGRDASFAMMD